ncbi:hypothetical protein J6590_105294, partial [Homalodisca vitripennis]
MYLIHELNEQHIYDKAYGRLSVVDSFDIHDFKQTLTEFVDSSGHKRQRNLVNLIYDICRSGTTHVMDVSSGPTSVRSPLPENIESRKRRLHRSCRPRENLVNLIYDICRSGTTHVMDSSTVHVRLLYDHLYRKTEPRKRRLHRSCRPRVYIFADFADKSSDDEEDDGRPQTRRRLDNESEHASRNRASTDGASQSHARRIVIMDRSTFSVKHIQQRSFGVHDRFQDEKSDDVLTVYLRTPVEEYHGRLKRRIHELNEQHIYDKAYGRLSVVDSFDIHDFKQTLTEFVDSSGHKRQRNLVNLIYDICRSGTTHVMDIHELNEQHIYDKAYGRLSVVDSFDIHDFKQTLTEFVDSSGHKRQRNLVNLIYDICRSGTTHVMD